MTESVNEVLGAEGLVDSVRASDESNSQAAEYLFHASAKDFKKIPGSPIAYWASKSIYELFTKKSLRDIADTRLGMATADNNKFLRFWYEVEISKCNFSSQSRDEAEESRKKWFPYQKGGDYRKWSGNLDYLVNWKGDGAEIRNFVNKDTGKVRSHNYNLDFIFKPGITWNALSSSKTSARFSDFSLFDNAGSSMFMKKQSDLNVVLAYMNSKVVEKTIVFVSPTLNFQPGDIASLPINITECLQNHLSPNVDSLINLSSSDWNTYETSWDFTENPLIQLYNKNPLKSLPEIYQSWWDSNQETIAEMQRLEEENNRLFIEAYGLQDELTPDVPLEEITLTVNPKYRYSDMSKKGASDDELAKRFQRDTIAELISYAVGCMFGRYSLNKPGLVLASQGEGLKDYLARVPQPSFMPDDDNVIPMIDFDGDWFEDDITERFKQFIKVAFGEENYVTNIAFIEESLGKDIRKYFLKDFYKDHVQTYKKRPIYWLYSSSKGTFNALIYLHRYRSDTVSVVLNEYLREFRTKLAARKENYEQITISAASTQKEKTAALKLIDKINKAMDEINDYEREVLYPLAGEQLEIDLDDGVKQNYPKFGKALKKVVGLS
jgi:hypothetical protein